MWVHMPQEHHGTEQDNYIKEILALTAEEILLESMLFFFLVCYELGFCKQLDLLMQIIYILIIALHVSFSLSSMIFI